MNQHSLENIKTQLIECAQKLYQRNMLAAADGNLSYRISDEQILMTPSGKPKAFLNKEDICEITLDNKIISGSPSSERLMHLQVYKNCPKAKCVIHAHPPTAIAWSIAKPDLKELPANGMSEIILAMGSIPFVPYARPSTEAMGKVLEPYLPKHRVMILSRHGGLSWGESIQEAHNGMERLEHSSQILKSAVELGGLTELPKDEIQVLRSMREKIGEHTL